MAFALIKTDGLDAARRERITREAQAIGRLGAQPHIVTIFEIGDEGGQPYVANELLAGGDGEGDLEASEGPRAEAKTGPADRYPRWTHSARSASTAHDPNTMRQTSLLARAIGRGWNPNAFIDRDLGRALGRQR